MSYRDRDEENGRAPRAEYDETRVAVDSWYWSRHAWAYVCCCVLITLLVVILIVSIVYWTNDDQHHSHVMGIISDMLDKNSLLSDAKNMVSLSSVFSLVANAAGGGKNGKLRPLSLCFTDLLRADGDGYNATLRVAQNMMPDPASYDYAVDMKMTMDFNVDPAAYKVDPSLHWMTISYLMTSTYTRFSSIRLLESGLDTQNRALVNTKEIFLCANNPAMNTRVCSTGDSTGPALRVKNSKLVVLTRLEEGAGARPGGTRKPKQLTSGTDGAEANSNTPKTGLDADQYDILKSDDKMSKYTVEEDFTKDIRVYNVLFYRSAHKEGSSTGHRVNSYEEKLALIVKPNKCK